MVQGGQAFLDVGAGAHFRGAADQHADAAAPDLVEQGLFLAVAVGVADGGDLLARDAAGGEFFDDVVVDAVTPGRRVYAQVAEDHLRTARRCRALPDGGDAVGQGVDLRAGEIGGVAREQPGVEGQLAPVGGDGQGVVLAGIDFLRAQAVVADDKQILLVSLPVRHRAGDDDRLAGLQLSPGQVEHLGGLHVGEGHEHLLQFREIHEAGEAAARAQGRAVGGYLHGLDHLAEGGRPGVEMLDAPAFQAVGVEEALHRVHLDHGVADRRAGGERHAVAGVLAVQVAGFHQQVEGALAAAGLDAGDAFHLGGGFEIFEVIRLVNEDMIDAQLVEHQAVVLLVLGSQVFQPLLAAGLLLLDRLRQVAAAAGAVGAGGVLKELVVLLDLPAQEIRLVIAAHADALEAAVGDDDAVPVTAGDLGGEVLAALLRHVLLGGDQQPGVGIKLLELAGELLEHVVGHGVDRLFDQPGLLHLHAGGGHGEGLAAAHNMAEQRVAAAHAPPDGVLLVRVQGDRPVQAGEIEVRAVEQAGAEIVVGVVVDAHQPLGAVGVGESPGFEPLLDERLLLPGGQRRLLVDDALLAVYALDRVVDGGGFQVQRLFQQGGAVDARGAVFAGGGDRLPGLVAGVEGPDGVFLQMADLDG